jgi:hypothetical protein
VTVLTVILFLDRTRPPKEQPRSRSVELASKCSWHFGMCAPLLTRSERPGLPSVTSLPRRSLSSPWRSEYRLNELGVLRAAEPPPKPPHLPPLGEKIPTELYHATVIKTNTVFDRVPFAAQTHSSRTTSHVTLTPSTRLSMEMRSSMPWTRSISLIFTIMGLKP